GGENEHRNGSHGSGGELQRQRVVNAEEKGDMHDAAGGVDMRDNSPVGFGGGVGHVVSLSGWWWALRWAASHSSRPPMTPTQARPVAHMSESVKVLSGSKVPVASSMT